MFPISVPVSADVTKQKILANQSIAVKKITAVFQDNNDPLGFVTITFRDYGLIGLAMDTGSTGRATYANSPTMNGIDIELFNPTASIFIIPVFIDYEVRH